jgi:hypothetical protein
MPYSNQLSLEHYLGSPEIVKPVNPFTSITPTASSSPVNQYPQLLPTVPSTVNTGLSDKGLLEYFLNKNQTADSAPLYEYKTSQEKRYDNPFSQYTPNIQGSFSTEDAYGKAQGAGEQILNSVIKTGANVWSSFIGGFTAIPLQIDALRKGNVEDALFATDSVFAENQEWLKGLEDKFPNYLTQIEQDRPWYINAFTPTGAANFWGDTILKNMGFTIGSLANALVVDAGLTLATEGTATPVTLVLAGKQISNAIKPLKSIFRNLAKVSSVGKIDDIAGMAKVSEGLLGGIKNTNKAFALKRSAQFLTTSYLATQGEAMIEGYQTYVDTKTKLLEQSLQEGKEFTPELLQGIEQTASHAGKMTTMFNTAVLGVSNLLQFPRIFGLSGVSSLLSRTSGSQFVGTAVKEGGLFAVNQFNKKQAVKNVLKDTFFKGFLTEGAEEGSQFFIGHTLHDYYIDKFNSYTKKDMLTYMSEAIPKTLQDDDFWKEFIIGGLSGMISGALLPGSDLKSSIKSNSAKVASLTTENLQKQYDIFNHAVSQLSTDKENTLISSSDKSDLFQGQYKAFHRAITGIIRMDSKESFLENTHDLQNLPLEEFNKLTNNKLTENERVFFLDGIRSEASIIENEMFEVEKNFTKNPFDTEYVRKSIIDKFKIPENKVKDVTDKLFSDFKENQVYLLGRLRNSKEKLDNLRDELRLGSNNLSAEQFSILETLLTSISETDKNKDAFQSYIRYKENILDTLKGQVDYYDELKMPLEKSKVKKEKDRLEKFLKSLKESEPQKIRDMLLEEEFSDKQAVDILEKFEELKKDKVVVENSKKEAFQAIKEPEKTAIETVNVIEEIVTQEEATEPQISEVEEDPLFIKNPKYYQIKERKKDEEIIVTLGDKSFPVTILEDKTLITTDKSKNPDNIEVSFTPNEVIINDQAYTYDVVSIKVKSKEKTSPASNPKGLEIFKSMIEGKELTDSPNSIGGRYIIKGSVFENGFTYYEFKGNGKFIPVFVDNDGNTIRKKPISFKKEHTFYVIDGQMEKKEALPTDSILTEEIIEIPYSEKINNFISTIPDSSAKAIFLQRYQEGKIEIVCS